MADVHVIYKGENKDVSFGDLFTAERRANFGMDPNVELSSRNVTEEQLKQALAQSLDVGIGELNDHYVELNPNGNATVRPNTTFGV
jgi:hypothetical protein